MRTASWTVHLGNCWVCVGLSSGVERSSLSTEFYPILKCPGSRETSVFSLPVAGGVLGLPMRLRIAHWLTESSNLRPPHWHLWRPWSCLPILAAGLRLSPPSGGFSETRRGRSSTAGSVVRTSYGRRMGVRTVSFAGRKPASVGQVSVAGDRTPHGSFTPAGSTVRSS
jgi:hypothetical protein